MVPTPEGGHLRRPREQDISAPPRAREYSTRTIPQPDRFDLAIRRGRSPGGCPNCVKALAFESATQALPLAAGAGFPDLLNSCTYALTKGTAQ